jgi:hypothetical protein
MESTKLTLSVKSDSLPLVKKYAKRQHTSVSKLVQQFFDSIVEKEKDEKNPVLEKYKDVVISDDIKSLTGIIKGKFSDDFDYRDAYREHLTKKHGL